jgi:hypothetical protein
MGHDQRAVLKAANVLLLLLEPNQERPLDRLVADLTSQHPEIEDDIARRAIWVLTSRGSAELTWDGQLRRRAAGLRPPTGKHAMGSA